MIQTEKKFGGQLQPPVVEKATKKKVSPRKIVNKIYQKKTLHDVKYGL